MTPWTAFDKIASALWVIALCSVAVTGRTFGLWPWLQRKVLALVARVR
jgi:hypothetical protein